MKLIRRCGRHPELAARLRDSGVPASVAYVAFWPGGKMGLKLEAMQVGGERRAETGAGSRRLGKGC